MMNFNLTSLSTFQIVNFTFVVYYFVEQLVKFVCFGWRRYVYEYWNVFDGVITVILVVCFALSFKGDSEFEMKYLNI